MIGILSYAQQLTLVNNYSKLTTQLAESNLRLSSGYRVNRAADDPSGIVAATRLSAEMARVAAQISNGQRLGGVIDTADASLGEISSLIGTIEEAVASAAGNTATAAERAAYQAEIDEAVDAIDRLVNTTSFNGTRLLDGSLGYSIAGVDSSKISEIQVRSLNAVGSAVTFTISATAAEKGRISYSGAAPASTVTLALTGDDGSAAFTWSSTMSTGNVATAVNAQTAATGVSAFTSAAVLYFRTAQTGSDNFVSINFTGGSLSMDGGVTSDYGLDSTVTVNGAAAQVDDLDAYFTLGSTNLHVRLTSSFTASGGQTTVTASGEGAGWRLDHTADGRIDYGLGDLGSSSLGNAELGYLNSLKSGGANSLASEKFTAAAAIVSRASDQVATERGRLGAIKSVTIDSTVNALEGAQAALADSWDAIMKVDYAAESARNQRLKVLLGINAELIGVVNQNASNVLTLLGWGRSA